MRPRSIILFERVFLGSAILAALNVFLNYGSLREYSLRHGGAAASALLGMTIELVIALVFWFLIARRASNGAKWVLIALTAVGIPLSISDILSGKFNELSLLYVAISVVAFLLNIVAIWLLFRADSKDWFKFRRKETPVDSSVFD
jgi:uncharacterized membrane protein